MTWPFSSPTDVANRAVQKLGGDRIDAGALFTGVSKEATEMAACYDALRCTELTRNTWYFAIRRVVLRAVGTALPNYDSTISYLVGALVAQSGTNYISLSGPNLGHDPSTDAGVHWKVFNGNTSLAVTFPAWDVLTAYEQGAVTLGSDSQLYECLLDNTGNDPIADDGVNWQVYFGCTVASAYDSTTSYFIGELVFDVDNTIWASLMNGNENDPSGGVGWLEITDAVGSPVYISWPAGTGPMTDDTSRNVFVRPSGFLRSAPADPKAGVSSFMGFPGNLPADDYIFEGPYITSSTPGALVLRFVANVTQVRQWHAMFCEGLACRLAYETCETLTNSNSKLQAIGAQYKMFMNEARALDAVQQGAEQGPLDIYISCRA